jgi:hypothetical protein
MKWFILGLACIAGMFIIGSGWLNPLFSQIAKHLADPFVIIIGAAGMFFALVIVFRR